MFMTAEEIERIATLIASKKKKERAEGLTELAWLALNPDNCLDVADIINCAAIKTGAKA
jgi:hypothetical protein